MLHTNIHVYSHNLATKGFSRLKWMPRDTLEESLGAHGRKDSGIWELEAVARNRSGEMLIVTCSKKWVHFLGFMNPLQVLWIWLKPLWRRDGKHALIHITLILCMFPSAVPSGGTSPGLMDTPMHFGSLQGLKMCWSSHEHRMLPCYRQISLGAMQQMAAVRMRVGGSYHTCAPPPSLGEGTSSFWTNLSVSTFCQLGNRFSAEVNIRKHPQFLSLPDSDI